MGDFKFKVLDNRAFDHIRLWGEMKPPLVSNRAWYSLIKRRYKEVFGEDIGLGSLKRALQSKTLKDYHQIESPTKHKRTLRRFLGK